MPYTTHGHWYGPGDPTQPEPKTTSSAETLRAAATVVRGAAHNATAGPWTVSRIPGIGRTVNDPTARLSIAVGTGWVSGADGEWIALMHPGLAEHLAAWLESVAERHNDAVYPGRCQWCVESWPCPDLREVLALARSILGRQS